MLGAVTGLKWDELAAAVRRRRDQKQLRQSDLEARGGPSSGTVRNIEQATRTSYSPRTFVQLEHALDWPDGTVEKILAGTATPSEVAEVVTRRPAATLQRVAAAQDALRPMGESVGRAAAVLGGLTATAGGAAVSPGDVVVEGLPVTTANTASDLTLAAYLVERLTRRQVTPKIDAAVNALLAAMPDLAARYPPPEVDEPDGT